MTEPLRRSSAALVILVAAVHLMFVGSVAAASTTTGSSHPATTASAGISNGRWLGKDVPFFVQPQGVPVPRGGASNEGRGQPPTTDQDRGWPLWFPRNFAKVPNNSNNAATTSSSAKKQRARKQPESKQESTAKTAADSQSDAGSAVNKTSSSPLLFRRKSSSVTTLITVHNETGTAQIEQQQMSSSSSTSTSSTNITTSNKEGSAANETKRLGTNESSTSASPIRTDDQPTNETATASSSEASSDQPPPSSSSPGVIVFGSGLPHISSYRIYRRPGSLPGLSTLDPSQPQSPSTPSVPSRFGLIPPGHSTPTSSPSEAFWVGEVIGHALGTVLRLWLIRSFTQWLAKQEELIQPVQHFVWERLNDQHVRDASALSNAIQAPPLGMSHSKWKRHLHRRRKQQLQHYQQQQMLQQQHPSLASIPRSTMNRRLTRQQQLDHTFERTVLVVDVIGDNNNKNGPDNEYLADLISFVLQQHRQHAFGTNWTTLEPSPLEIVLLIQSPGGSVASFGLAAAQIQRLSREHGITTTVCVDKYAASGGYMIASQAHQLIAAPFASVGSVGVIMEGLNFYEIAKKYGIQPLVLKSGESKNPITTFGSISKQDLAHQTEQLEKVHEAFKELVVQGRPALKDNLDLVANGNVFLGQEAMTLNMIDRVKTSSEYVLERIEAGDRVLKLHKSNPSRFPRRVHLSPLDVLPHLKSFLSGNHGKVVASWLVQGATYLGFLHHLYMTYRR